jgi:hypothetical protein
MTTIEIGDFVEDLANSPTMKGRVIAIDTTRSSPAVIVKYTNGDERSVSITYLRKLEKGR